MTLPQDPAVTMASQDIKALENGPDHHLRGQEDDDKTSPTEGHVDPFGAEEMAEVKYKTLTWW